MNGVNCLTSNYPIYRLFRYFYVRLLVSLVGWFVTPYLPLYGNRNPLSLYPFTPTKTPFSFIKPLLNYPTSSVFTGPCFRWPERLFCYQTLFLDRSTQFSEVRKRMLYWSQLLLGTFRGLNWQKNKPLRLEFRLFPWSLLKEDTRPFCLLILCLQLLLQSLWSSEEIKVDSLVIYNPIGKDSGLLSNLYIRGLDIQQRNEVINKGNDTSL